jgi:hypothetical protein
MIELRDGVCLALEALAEPVVGAQVRVEELERDRPVERLLHALEHQPHAAAR